MARHTGRLLHWNIYETHLDEAAFRWTQWEQALEAPDFTLAEVAELEELLAAHIDGLVLGGESVARQLLEPSLASEEPERVIAAALSLLHCEAPPGATTVIEALKTAEPTLLPALHRPFSVAPFPALLKGLPVLLSTESTSPELLALVLDTLATHKAATAQDCMPFVAAPEPHVAAAAIRAAARSRLALAPSVIQRALNSSSSLLRDAAIIAGLMSGQRAAWGTCQDAAAPGGPGGRLPLLLLGLNGDERDVKRLQSRLTDEPLQADVLWALGFSGRVSAADACVEFLERRSVAALAGEAFSAITGLRIEGDFVLPEDEQAAQEPVPLEDEDLDADLKPKPEDALPLPQAAKVVEWWQQARPKLDAKQRYLAGHPYTPQVLLDALLNSTMRRRHVLALDLELRSQGTLQVPTRMSVAHQLEVWKTAKATQTPALHRAFAEVLRE